MMKKIIKKERSSILICILVLVSLLTCNIPVVVELYHFRVTKTAAIMMKISAVTNPLIYFFKGYLERRYAKKKLASSLKDSEVAKVNGRESERSENKGRSQKSKPINRKDQNAIQDQNTVENTV